MRLLLLLPLIALSACTLSLKVLPAPRIQDLETQATYCTAGNTQVDFRFFLEGYLDRLEFFWLPEGMTPDQALPQERWTHRVPLGAGTHQGWLEVTPAGEVRALALASPQGIGVEPLPHRRLWLRGYTEGVPGPYVAARNPVRPTTSSCDPSW